MRSKINLIIALICFSWIFVFIGLTAILDDYYSLGWWWHLMLLPTWIWIIYSYYKMYIDWKKSKLKQKG